MVVALCLMKYNYNLYATCIYMCILYYRSRTLLIELYLVKFEIIPSLVDLVLLVDLPDSQHDYANSMNNLQVLRI